MGWSSPGNPTTLSDVYFRVGGPHVGKTDTALEVNSDNVLIDHTWVWRADHGVEGFTDTQRWQTNTGRKGAGVYVFNQNNPSIHTENGFEVPKRPGVKLHHIMTVNLSAGIIDHVVNGVGDAADTTKAGQPVYIAEYPAP